jgi:FlaA1/EpsC-like NDP-sugar epimerase
MKDKLTFRPNPELEGKTVLITGAGGTIGSSLVGAMLNQGAKVVAVDISEYAIYRLNERFDIRGIVGDVSDKQLLDLIFAREYVDYIFHCAAYKHVDMSEDDINTYSYIKNNVRTTQHLLEYPVEHFILISSDKAVNPSNTMGRTKQQSEQLVRERCSGHYAIVRFGNVYNSSGSFVETMNRQITEMKPITLTDMLMTRFFLTIHDATSLINEVVRMNESGTYVLDMGEEIRIVDLIPESHPIRFIGMRPGEKINEEIVSGNEILVNTNHELIKRVERVQ